MGADHFPLPATAKQAAAQPTDAEPLLAATGCSTAAAPDPSCRGCWDGAETCYRMACACAEDPASTRPGQVRVLKPQFPVLGRQLGRGSGVSPPTDVASAMAAVGRLAAWQWPACCLCWCLPSGSGNWQHKLQRKELAKRRPSALSDKQLLKRSRVLILRAGPRQAAAGGKIGGHGGGRLSRSQHD